MPEVSTIIPVYNGAAFVAEAIDSALAQEGVDQEIIVVDDGSTDQTPTILASYGNRIRVIRQPNAGQARARNAGMAAARGQWIAFLDADDVWLPDKLIRQLQACDGFDWCSTNAIFFNTAAGQQWIRYPESEDYTGDVFETLLVANIVIISSAIVRRKQIDRIGGFNPRYPGLEDWDFWIRLGRICQLKYLPVPLVKYRLHQSSMSAKVRAALPVHLRLIEDVFGSDQLNGSFARLRRRALANSYQINARFAAINGDWTFAVYCAARSLLYHPAQWQTVKLLCKSLLMPLGVKY